MKQFTKVLLCLSALGLASKAHSFEKITNQKTVERIDYSLTGDWSSGGGNAIVCFHRSASATVVKQVTERGYIDNSELDLISSIEMYDLFEAKLPRGIEGTKPAIIEIPTDMSIKDFNRGLAARYLNYANTIFNSYQSGDRLLKDSYIRFHQGAVKQQNDIGQSTFIDKSRCVIQTMAIQRNVGKFFELFIDSRLFNHRAHSRQSKAALMLHEKIYAYSRFNLEHQSSHSTRKVVELMVSRHEAVTLDSILGQLPQLGYKNKYFLDEDPYQFNSIFQSGLFEKVLDNAPLIFNHAISAFETWSFESDLMWELAFQLRRDGFELSSEDRNDFEKTLTKYYLKESNISRETRSFFEQMLNVRAQEIRNAIDTFMKVSAFKFIYEQCADYSAESKSAAYSLYLHFLTKAQESLTKYIILDGDSGPSNSILQYSKLSNSPESIASLATDSSLFLLQPFEFVVK